MDAQLGRQRVTVSPNAEACRNMADLGWKCLCLIGPTCCQEDRGNVVPEGSVFLILEEKHSTFHTEYDIGLLYVAFIILGYVPSITNLLRVFVLKRVLHFLERFFSLLR